MDKTFNDLMDIVNRTKKINGDSDTPRVTRRVRREEPMDEAVDTVREIRPARDLDQESKPSLFADKSAINKLLNSKSTKKSSTAKSTAKKETKKSTAKKTADKKTPAKKSTTTKKETTITKKAPAPKVVPNVPSIDMSDPRNVELYNALQGTLFAGGTDISDYVENDKLESAANNLKAIKERKKVEQINEEITKEQQEYEKLFTGSFFSESDVKTEEEEVIDETPKFEASKRQVVREKQLDQDIEEIKVRDIEIDRKIADYYKQKQEKINQYNQALYSEEVEEKPINEYEDRQKAYEDVFSGQVISRAKLMGEEEPQEDKTEDPVENEEQDQDIQSSDEKETEETKESEEDSNDFKKIFQQLKSHSEEVQKDTEDSEDSVNTDSQEVSETIDDAEVEENNDNEDSSEEIENSIQEDTENSEDNEEVDAQELQEDNQEDKIEDVEVIDNTEEIEDNNEEIENNEENDDDSDDDPAILEKDESEEVEENLTEDNESDDAEVDAEEPEEEEYNPFSLSGLTFGQDREKVEPEVTEDSKTEDSQEQLGESEEADIIEEMPEVIENVDELPQEDSVDEDSETEVEEDQVVAEIDDEENTQTIAEVIEEDQEESVISLDIDDDTQEDNESEDEIESIAQNDSSEVEKEEIEEPQIDEEKDNIQANAFVESVEDSMYGDDYSKYDDEELDRMDGNDTKRNMYSDDDLIVAEEFDEEIEPERNIYNMSQDDELEDYIVSSNVPDEIEEVEEQAPLQEYIEEDNSLVLDTRALPESQIDVLGEEVETKEEEKVEEKVEEPEENNSISKEEFYNEMARLQQNLINELKGQKVDTESKDFFEEKKEPQPQPEELNNSSLNKALDIINNLTNKPSEATAQPEPVEIKIVDERPIEVVQAEAVPQEETNKTEEPQVEEQNTATEENTDAEAEEKFENIDLLDKDTALNEEDLKYFDESLKPRDLEKDACFYMSDEDKTKKAEFEDEYLDVYNEETGHNVEVGDINLNKDIQNAIPLSELFKNNQKEVEVENNEDEEMENIYTLFGVERKKMGKTKEDIKVLYVASECQPFIATGGLADVAGSLPKAVAEIGGIDIRVIMPLYGNIKAEYRDKFEYLGNFTVHLSWRQEYCGLFRYTLDGVTYYFIDNERYFKRDKTYGYYDDGERFAYFCKAIVESLPVLNFFPDIIHCNDWQSSLVSAYIKTGNWSDFRYYKIKNIYTIHNVEYQGVYGMENLKDLFGIDYRFRNDLDYNGDINLTKAAIQYSDKFTTVSESYCDNLKQPYCSRGLHHIIIRNDYKLSGIINGIDYNFYNPETDKIIYKNYNVDTLKDKVMNKKIWQDELGLPVDARTPMLAIVSRLVSHKGLDLLSKVIEDVLQKDIQLVVVGTGDQRFVDYYKYLESKYPTKVRAMVDKFSSDLARKAYAASDIFIMPSKIEPCGISQMIASRYGAIPVVREVGGLKDSIKDFGCPEGGNGYTFTNYNPNDLSYQINRAIDDYQDQANWEKKMKIAMTTDFRWQKSAEKYVDLYKSLV